MEASHEWKEQAHFPTSAIAQVSLRAALPHLSLSLHKAGLVPQHVLPAMRSVLLPWLHLPANHCAHPLPDAHSVQILFL